MDLGLHMLFRALGRRRSAVTLLVVEVAVAFVVIAILLTTSHWFLGTAEFSFGRHTGDLLAVVAHTPRGSGSGSGSAEERRARLGTTLAALPEVYGVSKVSGGTNRRLFDLPVAIIGRRDGAVAARGLGWVLNVGQEFPEVLGLELAAGVPFSAVPAPARADALLVTRCLARLLGGAHGEAGALGLTIEAPGARGRVVGVVEDLTLGLPMLRHSGCALLTLAPWLEERLDQLVLRTAPGRRGNVLAVATAALARNEPGTTVLVETYDEVFSRYRRPVRGLVVVFGFIALEVTLLALIGAMAVSSFLVAERRFQIALRRALGATRGSILRYFLVENLIATVLGNLLGFVLVMLLFPNMQRAFQGIELQPALLILAGLVLCAAGLFATWVPAARAARVSPALASGR